MIKEFILTASVLASDVLSLRRNLLRFRSSCFIRYIIKSGSRTPSLTTLTGMLSCNNWDRAARKILCNAM